MVCVPKEGRAVLVAWVWVEGIGGLGWSPLFSKIFLTASSLAGQPLYAGKWSPLQLTHSFFSGGGQQAHLSPTLRFPFLPQ